ncbi:hypothetical protein M2103_001314 [Ereboglobus sp. PH5-5]|uniref:hypothetical protein n=1 Tax=Ereboglobus sp. PH5-5 TaxID=2940529 RepID=UPI0024075C3F|nr:hypothetical protein [Ereboglobus sp. PH5-5]MDF9833097.1 hypothetical protein [Ereboglobus sp. PH5-5]
MKSASATDHTNVRGDILKNLGIIYQKLTRPADQKRLNVLIDYHKGELTAEQVAKKHGVSRRSVFRYESRRKGVKKIKGARAFGRASFHKSPHFDVEIKQRLVTEMRWGGLKTAKSARAWLKKLGFPKGKCSEQCIYAVIRSARKVAMQEDREGIPRFRRKASWEK